MKFMLRLAATLFLAFAGAAWGALDPALLQPLAGDDSDAKVATVLTLAGSADPVAGQVLRALASDALFLDGERLFRLDGETPVEAATGVPLQPVPEGRDSVTVNNRLRGVLDQALALLDLRSSDVAVRRSAAGVLVSHEVPLELAPLLMQAAARVA